jgi:hypothetical protein
LVPFQATYEQRPLDFEINQGQAAEPVEFLAHGPGYTLFLTGVRAVLSLRSGSDSGSVNSRDGAEVGGDQPRSFSADGARPVLPILSPAATSDVLQVQLVSGAPRATVGEAELPCIVNYLIGDDPARWRAGVPTFGRVRPADVYPGIDLVYDAQGANLDYDFVLAPGTTPGRSCCATREQILWSWTQPATDSSVFPGAPCGRSAR